jgi:four helix bundle protein
MRRNHHDLQVWQEGMALAREIYAVTAGFPKEETFGLTSQMRRSAVSVPSNIAEGAARGGKREFHQFLVITRGSLMELETQVILSHDLGYVEDHTNLMEKINKVFALLNGLMAKLNKA